MGEIAEEKIMSKVSMSVPDSEEEKPRATAAVESLAEMGSWPTKTKTFIDDVKAEARRVTWPNRKQIQATTVVVLITVFFFGAYFGILDWAFNYVVRRILKLGS